MSECIEENDFLNDSWSLYFHDPYDIEWTTESYKLIGNISTINDFVNYFWGFRNLFNKGMFFFMRTDIMPRWEDEMNCDGGCFSFKISSSELEERWFAICANALGENIGIDDNICYNINGVSISPKKFFYIVRIWIKDKKYAKKEYYKLDIPKYSTLMYKNHIEK
jgi:hypothetical protein